MHEGIIIYNDTYLSKCAFRQIDDTLDLRSSSDTAVILEYMRNNDLLQFWYW